ncbi:AfsR/SARP family transcriptional regulator [Streptomyces tremellae]
MASGIFILGPVELRCAGRREPVGTGRESLTLAALAVDAGRPVPLEGLVHRLWGDEPPGRPRTSVHAYVARLRKRLARCGDTAHLVHQAHSYTLDVDPDAVDLHFFSRLTAEARALADEGAAERALGVMDRAAGLWRGEPLAGLPGLWAAVVRRNLAAKRFAADMARLGTELRLGRYAQLLPDLTTLADQHPTDETLAGYLMVAQYGCHRQADALRTYDAVRHRLSAELGTGPGESLARLHRLVLEQVPAGELLAGTAGRGTAPRTLPAQASLVGREQEMARLLAGAQRGARPPDGGTVQIVTGGPGVGKSTLVGAAARRLAPHYPAGQVHVDLRGYSPGLPPLTPEAALTSLLRDFGVPAGNLPADLPGLLGAWRTLLADRAAVIVLDDAADAKQVRPLLPGDSPSAVLVTSRHRLTGLPGARSLDLDDLPMDSAIALFRRIAGEERTRNLPEVRRITEICTRLPLALEIVAGRFVSRPSWTTGHLIGQLDREHRLGEIRNGSMEITATFAMSVNALDRDQRRAFRLLSLHVGGTFGAHAAAALTGRAFDSTERILEELLYAHIIREPEADRYAFHDLLREYAKDLATDEDQIEERDAARARLMGFYVRSCELAASMVYPHRGRLASDRRPECDASPPPWNDADHARRWLHDEYEALIEAERVARSAGDGQTAALLSHALAPFFQEESLFATACTLHEAAAEHWRRTGDRAAEGAALVDLANAQTGAGRYDEAHTSGLRALATARAAHSRQTVAEGLRTLSILAWNRGRHAEAKRWAEETLALRREDGDLWQISRALNNLGIFHLYLGNYEASYRILGEALEGFRETGDAKEMNRALVNLANVHMETGDHASARRILEGRLDYALKRGNDAERAIARVNLADAMTGREEAGERLALYGEGLKTFLRLDDKRNASITLHDIGLVHQQAGRHTEALESHRRSLAISVAIGARLEECRALWGCGVAESRLGDAEAASRDFDKAMAIAESLGSEDDVARVRASLAELRAAREGDTDSLGESA